MNNLKGLGVALVTPFNEDLSIDFESLTKLIEYNIDNGTNFLVVLGTTAETATPIDLSLYLVTGENPVETVRRARHATCIQVR